MLERLRPREARRAPRPGPGRRGRRRRSACATPTRTRYPARRPAARACWPLKEDLVQRRAARRSSSCWPRSALVLLIACANVANLTLARLLGAQPRAGGARGARRGPRRLLRQLLTESTIAGPGRRRAGPGCWPRRPRARSPPSPPASLRAPGEVHDRRPRAGCSRSWSPSLTGILAGTLPGLPAARPARAGPGRRAAAATGDRRAPAALGPRGLAARASRSCC